jgi:cell division septation protein DedD
VNNSENESQFELVLGNRQLLSGFFIIVILFGVFFAMGYIVGRNSYASGKVAAAGAQDTAPAVSAPEAKPEAASPPPVMPPASEPPPVAKPIETPAPAVPAPGETYLQVTAVKRPDAEMVADVLRKKGFPALVAPSPNAELFRVLVGPFPDASSMNRTKADLEAAGFKSIIRR